MNHEFTAVLNERPDSGSYMYFNVECSCGATIERDQYLRSSSPEEALKQYLDYPNWMTERVIKIHSEVADGWEHQNPILYFRGKNGTATHMYWGYHIPSLSPPIEGLETDFGNIKRVWNGGDITKTSIYGLKPWLLVRKNSRSMKALEFFDDRKAMLGSAQVHAAWYDNPEWLTQKVVDSEGIVPNVDYTVQIVSMIDKAKRAQPKKLIEIVGEMDEMLSTLETLREARKKAMAKIMGAF